MQNSRGDDESGERTAEQPAGPQVPSGDDAAVELEWKRLERRRIEEERAEARENAAVEHGSGPRLPWTALLAALTAGLIAAVILNAALGTLRPQVESAVDAAGEKPPK